MRRRFGGCSRLLSRRGHTVTEAPSVREALARIERESFDVVLCDVTLGDESGLPRRAREPSVQSWRSGSFRPGAAGAASLHADQKLRVLAKPFTAADLQRVLAEVVASPQTL